MGGGTSNLNDKQIKLLSKEMKSLIEKYEKQGLSDAVMQRKLTHDYNRIYKSIEVPVSQMKQKNNSTASKSQGTVGLKSPAKPIDLNKKNQSKQQTSTRRRSFDASKNDKTKEVGPSKLKTVNSKSEAALPTAKVCNQPESSSKDAEDNSPSILLVDHSDKSGEQHLSPTAEEQTVDSWDSVSQQPYCTICHMAFKSLAFLDRHVKFSDLHKRTEEKMCAVVETPGPPTVVFDALDGSLTRNQSGSESSPPNEEGRNYKLLYNGSKLFWRTQDDVEMQFFHHVLPHMIEVICHDTKRRQEMNRIYLSYDIIFDILVEHKDLKNNEQNFNKIRKAITTYILQRLQLNKTVDNTTVIFTKIPSDIGKTTPVVVDIPDILIPISVSRRRRSSKEEIDLTINQLSSERAALCEATERAAKIGSLVHKGATELIRKKWWADFSQPRKLWIWAIRRVIRQKLVAETTEILKARNIV